MVADRAENRSTAQTPRMIRATVAASRDPGRTATQRRAVLIVAPARCARCDRRGSGASDVQPVVAISFIASSLPCASTERGEYHGCGQPPETQPVRRTVEPRRSARSPACSGGRCQVSNFRLFETRSGRQTGPAPSASRPSTPPYGAGFQAAGDSPHALKCELVEAGGRSWRTGRPTRTAPRRVAFVDDTLRTEARLTRTAGEATSPRALAGSWAATDGDPASTG